MSYAHDLARAYNQRLAERDHKRAEEIEWYVTNGNIRLRDIPEWSHRRASAVEQTREYERQEFNRRNGEAQYSDPHRML